MAIPLTSRLDSLSKQIAKTPQLILEIEGVDGIYSTSAVFELTSWDDVNISWDDGTTWDSITKRSDVTPLISWKGSQRTLAQQIRPDKSSTQSVPTFNISIVDKNNQVARDLSFDAIEEQLGKKCNVYLNLEGGLHPQDSIPIIFGFLDEFTFKAGSVVLSVSHASNLQRQGLFTQATTELTANINNTTTTIPVSSVAGFIEASDSLKSFLQLGDEIMQVVSSSPAEFTVVRGALNTTAVSHSSGDEVLSYYTLSGKPLDLALKLLLSNPEERFRQINYQVSAIEYVNPTESVDNAIIFDYVNIEEITGLIQGDIVRISGSLFNDGDYTILSFGITDDGRSFIVVQENLTEEPDGTNIIAEYRSQFNVLNEGLGLENREVDSAGMVSVATINAAEFIDYEDLPIKESMENAKDFIEKELYFPQNLYSIPRKARVSAKYTIPPLSIDIVPTLNTSNVINIEDLDVARSIHKYYYNAVRYAYNVGFNEDKFFRSATFVSGQSSRIRTGNSILAIPATGIRETAATFDSLTRLSNRLLGRYQFAALEIKKIQVLFRDSLNLEVGDIIPFGGESTQLPDPQTGQRNLPVKLYEVINKSLDVQSGKVSLDIVETGFGLFGRRTVFAPSSGVAASSTTSEVIVENVSTSDQFLVERQKYESFLGAAVRVYSPDYTYDESSFIAGFSDGNENGILLSPPLSSAPSEGYVFEVDIYDNQPANEAGELIKLKYGFFMEQAEITAVTDSQTFDVAEVTNLFEGQIVSIHSNSYIDDSFGTTLTIDDITGNTITLSNALSFTPSIGDKLETYSFEDGDGYIIL